MKILFIRKNYNEKFDGGDIYNLKIIKNLKMIGYLVDEIAINKYTKGILPFWKWKFYKSEIEHIIKKQVNYDKTIISHENLSELTKYIRCDLFIFQNLISKIRGKFVFTQMLYKMGAKNLENIAIKNSKKCLVLSMREYRLSTDKKKFCYYPPGINPLIKCSSDENIVTISSSSGWLLKRMSKLNRKEIENLNKYFNIKFDNVISKVGILEDKFDCGFKLRLIQMLFNCEVIITKMDFKEEIIALGCSTNNVFQFDDFSKINFNNLLLKIDKKSNEVNKKILNKNYSWDVVASKIAYFIN